MHIDCHHTGCPGFEIEIESVACTADELAKAIEVRQAHIDSHIVQPAETHIRKRINPRGVKGNGFYKVRLSSAEDGSQTLCGGKATTEDMGYGETRYARNLAFVSCERCKELRGNAA